ncbi:MAG TPA: cell division protein FtsL [candidate division Zixibacteria bacterium]|jgi:cell division protein FtsL
MKRSRRRRIHLRWWLLAFGLATMAVWQRYAVVKLGEDVDHRQREITELTRVRDDLLAETAVLSSRERIEAIAVNRLGMKPTTAKQRREIPIDAVNPPASPNDVSITEKL